MKKWQIILLTAIATFFLTMALLFTTAKVIIPSQSQLEVIVDENYGDELVTLDKALLMLEAMLVDEFDYLIVGLMRTEQFQQLLLDGLKKGYWTEDFLNQFVKDDLIPIMYNHTYKVFMFIGENIKASDEFKELTFKLGGAQEAFFYLLGQIPIFKKTLNDIKYQITTKVTEAQKIYAAAQEAIADLIVQVEDTQEQLQYCLKNEDGNFKAYGDAYTIRTGSGITAVTQYWLDSFYIGFKNVNCNAESIDVFNYLSPITDGDYRINAQSQTFNPIIYNALIGLGLTDLGNNGDPNPGS